MLIKIIHDSQFLFGRAWSFGDVGIADESAGFWASLFIRAFAWQIDFRRATKLSRLQCQFDIAR
jgi:hypothetical protein